MKRLLLYLLGALLLLGCTQREAAVEEFPRDGDGMERLPYLQIDQAEAMAMMEREEGYVILDVRRQDEYEAGHIPGAILIPNETIETEPPEALPDYGQLILVYCRSGNRSKQAAEKLGKMGYYRVYEFGGINTWPGPVVTGSTPEGDASGK